MKTARGTTAGPRLVGPSRPTLRSPLVLQPAFGSATSLGEKKGGQQRSPPLDQAEVDEMRNIPIVESHGSLAMSLSLYCLAIGDDSGQAFTVEIPKNKSVSILKKQIKEEKSPQFDHIVASDLARYLKLSPTGKKLDTFFTDVADDCLHVIVRYVSVSTDNFFLCNFLICSSQYSGAVPAPAAELLGAWRRIYSHIFCRNRSQQECWVPQKSHQGANEIGI